jgi:hypothetical protein
LVWGEIWMVIEGNWWEWVKASGEGSYLDC